MERGGLRRLRESIVGFEAAGVAGALIVICIILSLATDTFFTAGNLLGVARRASDYGIVAVAMVFVLAMGEVDLSVGAVATLVNVLAAIALRAGAPVWLAVIVALACGSLCGAMNGLLSVALRAPVIIVTLGTMSLYRGLAVGFSRSQSVGGFSTSSWFFRFFGGDLFYVPIGVWVLLAVCAAGHVLLNYTAFGWRVQAIGSNRQAARFSGIPLRRYRVAVMTVSGAACALVALVSLAFYRYGSPTVAGPGFELLVVASAIIGGTGLSGGSGSIVGAVLGALLIAVIDNGLGQLRIASSWSQAVTGGVIILAVAVSALIKRNSDGNEST